MVLNSEHRTAQLRSFRDSLCFRAVYRLYTIHTSTSHTWTCASQAHVLTVSLNNFIVLWHGDNKGGEGGFVTDW